MRLRCFARNASISGLAAPISDPVGQHDLAGPARGGLDEAQRPPVFDACEQGRAAAENDGVNDQPEFIDEALVGEARYDRGAADDVDRTTWLLLDRPEFADLAHQTGC